MNLLDYQRAVMRVAFSREPAPEDLRALGEQARWQTYRHMVRTRIEEMSRNAFRETCALLEDTMFRSAFARYLEQSPPKSPLIRDVVAAFGGFLEASEYLAAGKPWARDMLRFERARWEVAYQQASAPVLGEDGVRELDFEGALVLNPVLRILTLDHPVHRAESDWPLAERTHLLVYRTIGAGEIRWWATTPLFASLLARAQRLSNENLADAVRTCATELELALDHALLESLSDGLTLALQRTVLVGVR